MQTLRAVLIMRESKPPLNVGVVFPEGNGIPAGPHRQAVVWLKSKIDSPESFLKVE